ncbi:AMP-dependent synthetase/ligase [Salinispora arenicola]|uniref:AMP-dependent synthetase/ligase n=1 Tax=Salinispora arenicola TaxID=168697 RepID=UPI00207A8805|nr:long-chain fatty acid--CoA ligase [Salinispora arenicola]MCN0179851.1 long-chain fatty acid--CoA ligase [Salinispora arenicola]
MRESTSPPLYEVPEKGGLADLIASNAAEDPDAPAFHRKVDGRWEPVSAAEFYTEVTDLARGLIAKGVERGDRVGLLSGNRYEWSLVDFALWVIGAAPVPIYLTSSTEQIEWILGDSGAVAVVVETEAHENVIQGMRGKLPALRHVWQIDGGAVAHLRAAGADVDPAAVEERRTAVLPEDTATIIYTSGTTGMPKGCVLSHANLFAEAGNAVALLRAMFGPLGDIPASTLLFLPLAHVFGRMVEVGAMVARTPIAHCSDVKQVPAELISYKPTFLLSVPYVLEKAYNTARRKAYEAGKGKVFDTAATTAIAYSEAQRPGLGLRMRHALFERLVYRRVRAAFGGNLRFAISGGAALGERLTHFYRGCGITVFEGYGLTETSAAVTVNSLDSFRPGTVGRVLPSVRMRIDDDGEVQCTGGPVFAGYWNNDEANAESFTEDGWFRTGDIGEFDEYGHLRITGRKKEILVTSGGKNVSPAVIEDRIAAAPLVAQALVVGDGQKYIAALITVDSEYLEHWKAGAGKPADAAVSDLIDDPDLLHELQRAVDEGNAAVSTAEAVRRFRVLPKEFTVESGHLTPSLKLRRSVIMADFADEVAELYS